MKVAQGLAMAALAVALAACTSGGTASPGEVAGLQVYAAASLKSALQGVATAYAAGTGTTLTVSTDSSSALETKIEEGAPADVFLAADTTMPQKLVDDGYAAGEVVPFAGNLLTVIVPHDNPAGIASVADLGEPGVKVIAAADGVPIQAYTAQLLERLASVDGAPADIAARYDANVVSREDNVSGIVSKVGLGEGDAGIVYLTDATASEDVTAIAIPADQNVPATYGAVVVKASPNRAAATAFLDWLAGPAGQAVLARYGFQPAP